MFSIHCTVFRFPQNRGLLCAAISGSCYMNERSQRSPEFFHRPLPRCPASSLWPLGSKLTHRRRLRGVCSTAPTPGATLGEGHPAGTSFDALFSCAVLLRLAKKSAGDSARRSGRGRPGDPRGGPRSEQGAGLGWGRHPRPRRGPRRVSFVYVAAQCAV